MQFRYKSVPNSSNSGDLAMNSNRYVCHSCRKPGHWFNDCPNKRRCPKCGKGFLKWFEVYKTHNVGNLFHSCSACDFEFDEEPTIVQSEVGESRGSSSTKTKGIDETIELARILKMLANITEENDVKISVTLTLSKGKRTSDDEDDGKEKEKGKGKGEIM